MKEAQEEPRQKEGLPEDVAIIFAAAAAGDASALSAALLASSSSTPQDAASYQDPVTGRSALFAAAEADSVECVALLLEAGAPWNATDRAGSCAGDAAVAKGCSDAAGALLEAGVRAELVLGAISEAEAAAAAAGTSSSPASSALPAAEEGRPYLTQRAAFHASASNGDATLSDEQGRAVMMEWEAGIMKATAHAVAKGAKMNEDGSGGGVGEEVEFFSFFFERRKKTKTKKTNVFQKQTKNQKTQQKKTLLQSSTSATASASSTPPSGPIALASTSSASRTRTS
jgi:protein arginine N-methyltransferase 2